MGKKCSFVSNYQNMTTLTLKLQLDESLALAYRQAKPKEKIALKQQIEHLFALQWRKQTTEELRQRNIKELILLMDLIGKEAEANGLTEDILDQILAES